MCLTDEIYKKYDLPIIIVFHLVNGIEKDCEPTPKMETKSVCIDVSTDDFSNANIKAILKKIKTKFEKLLAFPELEKEKYLQGYSREVLLKD
jgi:hypothetical protein